MAQTEILHPSQNETNLNFWGEMNRQAALDIIKHGAAWVGLDLESTITSMEFWNYAAEIKGSLAEVDALTNSAMEGKLDFYQALLARLSLTMPTRQLIYSASLKAEKNLAGNSISFMKLLRILGTKIRVISGGFKEVSKNIEFKIGMDIYANDFVFRENHAVGINDQSILSYSGGKRMFLINLINSGELDDANGIFIGDGASDLGTYPHPASLFVCFTGFIDRKEVSTKSPIVCSDFAPLFVFLAGEKNWDKIFFGSNKEAKYLFMRGAQMILSESGKKSLDIKDPKIEQELHSRLTLFLHKHFYSRD